MIHLAYKHGLSLLSLLLLFEICAEARPAGRYPIRNFTPIDYKAGIQNIDFAQNRNASIYVANNLGVLSFNGSEWQTHHFKTGKKKRSLAFDPLTNRLYMGSQGDFGYFHEDWQYESLSHLLPDAERDFTEVWDVYLLDEKVYFCTFSGIFCYDGSSITVIKPQVAFERSFLVNGRLFTQDQNGRLYVLENGQLTVRFAETRQNETIAGLIPQGNELLLLYNSGYIANSNPFGESQQHEQLAATLQGTFVNHVTQLSDNRLAIATQRAGLFLYDLQTAQIEHLSTQTGLESNACLRTFQDYTGNLWVGMQNGIALVHLNAPLRLLGKTINLQGSGYDSYDLPEGTYFTTSNGIYFLRKGASRCTFLPGTEGPAYRIQEIAGNIYAGHHTGLFLLHGTRAIRQAYTDGLWQLRPLQSQPGYVVGGTYSGLYLFRINDQGTVEPVHAIDGFQASSRFMEEDRQGYLWVGQYYLGLYRLHFSNDYHSVTVENISETSDLPIKEQIILSKINEDLYLATRSGIFRINTEAVRVEPAPEFTEVGAQPVYLLAQDKRNRIHLVTESFIAYYDPLSANNYQLVRSSLYQLRYLLNNDLLYLATPSSDGVLFSANDGFIHYNPQLEYPAGAYPITIRQISDLKQNRAIYRQLPFAEPTQSPPSLSIQANIRRLKLEVESFQLGGLENQEFRYRLEGLEDEYGDWTPATSREYSNLPSGKYTFMVQSRNQVGQYVASMPYSFTVRAPFYKTQGAKVVYVLLSCLFVAVLLRLQRRVYQKKTARQENAQQRELLQLQEEKMQSELKHINNLLGASTMNLVVKNEFIESVKNDLQDIKQKVEGKETRKSIEKIVREIDTNLRIQEDWEQFQYHFDAVHGDFLSRLRTAFPDISPNEQKLCAFLRLNLQTKDIAHILGVSVRGVEVARYRLRKKLQLEKGQNLSKFILEY